jgi:UDP-N-acetylglucosamine acyltransferase
MTELIHPSAIVDRRARLGRDVVIGAFSVVGAGATLEDGVEIGHHVVLEGRVVLGDHAKVGHASIVGAEPQDLKFRSDTNSGVRIGPRTVLREHVTVHRATAPDGWTEIGADCLLMSSSHVAHDCRLGDGVILINYAGISGHCQIDDRATIGGLTGLHPFTRVGEHAYVGGVAKVVSDVPPYVLADGTPATARSINVIGLRRAAMVPAERRALQDAFRILYRSGHTPAAALARLRDELGHSPAVAKMIAFVAASKRGICHAPRRGDLAEAAGRTDTAGVGAGDDGGVH